MTASLTLSMIVRDGAELLPACLASVRGIVDEIVVADTGSQDATVEVAKSFGARVTAIPWNNDFAEARNAALQGVDTHWVLSLDADEQLDENARRQIPRLLKNSGVAGYQVTIRNYLRSIENRLWDRPAKRNDAVLPASRKYPAYVEHQNVRLFCNDAQIYFIGRVHESVGPMIEKSGRRLGEADFLIHHFGLAGDENSQARKNQFYRELGRQKIREMPENAQAYFELGLLEMDNFHNLDGAHELFARARALNIRFGLAWFFEGLTLEKLGQHEAALRCLAEAERSGYRTALLAETRGDIHYNAGDFASARECYLSARRWESLSASLQSKFGLAVLRAGDRHRGLRELRSAVVAAPAQSDVHDRLILALVWMGDLHKAAAAAEAKLVSIEAPSPGDYLRCASLWSKAEDWPKAAVIARDGLQAYPCDPGLAQAAEEIAARPQAPDLVHAMK